MVDKDTVDIRYLKTFLVGPPGVGKTTTLDRLLKVIENICSAGDQCQSTLLANCIQVLALVPAEGSETKWLSSRNVRDEAKLTFGYVCYRMPSGVIRDIEKGKLLKGVIIGDTVKFPKAGIEKPHQHLLPKTTKEIPRKSDHSQLQPPKSKVVTVPDYQNRLTHIKAEFQNIIKRGDYSTIARNIGDTLLNINDIGGQPGFLEMLPALSTGPAMYLVFFDLSKKFDEPYNIPFSRDGKIITPYKAVHTVRTTICQILSAIASVHSISRESTSFQKATAFSEKFNRFHRIRSVAALIGTHKDELIKEGNVGRKLEQIDDDLKKVKQKFEKIVTSRSTSGTSFFSVDNYNGTEQSAANNTDSDDITSIREYMNNSFPTHFKEASLPLRPKWLIFSSMLRIHFKLVKMKDCLELGKMLEMDKEEIEFCLWYLDCIGTLMYFDNITKDEDGWFKNHVICSPQVVFDSISQLIVSSMCTLHSESHVIDHDRDELIKRGQFSIESIEKYSNDAQITEKIEEEELIPAEQLIKLLKHVNLLSPIVHKEADGSKRITYLMPAVLECATQDELTTPLPPDANNPESLFVTFKCGYVPTGTFCGLITRLVSLGPHGILGLVWELVEECVKRNCVSFHVAIFNKVTLIAHERCYEIRVTLNHKKIKLHNLCSYVFSAILYTLKSLYNQLVPQLAFQCTCLVHESSRGDDHLCTLCEDSLGVAFVCRNNPVDLNKHQQIWFGVVSS